MIGTIHYGFTFTVHEVFDAVRDVVYYIASFEQIRASVPMYFMSRKMKAVGHKAYMGMNR
jgi:asparagine synthase (glutamine-hydrolysing)